MGVLRKIASISTVGVVSFRDPAEQQIRAARKVAKADARVAALEQARAQLEAKRSQAVAVPTPSARARVGYSSGV